MLEGNLVFPRSNGKIIVFTIMARVKLNIIYSGEPEYSVLYIYLITIQAITGFSVFFILYKCVCFIQGNFERFKRAT